MGKTFATYSDDELDRPDLNKCPDCGCFFAEDNCPLCGKPCPEAFRAGNRKPVKKKRRRRSDNGGRVTFTYWYHSWWFIILMLFFFPLIGFILLATSPHKRSIKIAVAAAAIAYTILSTFGLSNIVYRWNSLWDQPVNQKLSREDYIAACESVNPESFYRSPESYTDAFVTMTLTVTKKIADSTAYYNGDDDYTYYVCHDESGTFEILVRDCFREGRQNFIPGDTITVWGEGAGNVEIYDMNGNYHATPCLHVAFAAQVGTAE